MGYLSWKRASALGQARQRRRRYGLQQFRSVNRGRLGRLYRLEERRITPVICDPDSAKTNRFRALPGAQFDRSVFRWSMPPLGLKTARRHWIDVHFPNADANRILT